MDYCDFDIGDVVFDRYTGAEHTVKFVEYSEQFDYWFLGFEEDDEAWRPAENYI